MQTRRPISEETYQKVFQMAGKVIRNYAQRLKERTRNIDIEPLVALATLMPSMTQETYPLLAKSLGDLPPSELCRRNAKIAGSRVCQDWKLEDPERPEILFTAQEKDDLRFNYELYNSRGTDYDPDYNGFHDEMVVSFVLCNELRELEFQLLLRY